MKFTVHTSQSEAVCTTSGGKMISYVHNEIPYLYSADGIDCGECLPGCFSADPEKEKAPGTVEDVCVLSENGLLSEQLFDPILLMPEKVSFCLENNTGTQTQFPCRFQVHHTYTVNDDGFSVKSTVLNQDTKPVQYHFGTEPVFSVPLYENDSYGDYSLEIAAVDAQLNAEHKADIEGQKLLFLDGEKDHKICLAKCSAESNTVIIDGPIGKQIRFYSEKSGHGIQVDPVGFRLLTIRFYKTEKYLYIKIFNYIPALSEELAAENARNPEPTIPADSEHTVGYVVKIL